MSRAIFSQSAALAELEAMLRWRRPARTKTEKRFVGEYVDSIPGIRADEYGNRFVQIGDSPVLWSCHTDSVHSIGGQQSIVRDGDLVRLHPAEKQSSCLGADCATGVWIMRQMCLRGVPGLYYFHRDEEIGGHGSQWVADNWPDMPDGITMAIALDRRGKTSVITHQGARCCSDAFALSLAAQLPGAYAPDSTGLFTDTANYTGVVAECSNLSIGYDGAHSPKEMQDMRFAALLLESLCELDASRLTIERTPEKDAFDEYDWRSAYSSKWSGWRDEWEGATQSKAGDNYSRILRLINAHPTLIADWLDLQGVDSAEIASEIGVDYRDS